MDPNLPKEKNELMEEKIAQLEKSVEKLQREVEGLRSTLAARQLALDLEKEILTNLFTTHNLGNCVSDPHLSVKIFFDGYAYYKDNPKEFDGNWGDYEATWVALESLAKQSGFTKRRTNVCVDVKSFISRKFGSISPLFLVRSLTRSKMV